MSKTKALEESLGRSFQLYRDFVNSIEEKNLNQKLSIPSNTIGEQLWCVIGARESYSKAIEASKWLGFSCSVNKAEAKNKTLLLDSIRKSEIMVYNSLKNIETFTHSQNRLLIDLLEHEIAHHGQLIRFLYGLRIEIPVSWKKRYALD